MSDLFKKYSSFSNIKEQLNSIKQSLEELEERYTKLSKENDRLRSEYYQEEEMKKMKERVETLEQESYRGFPISKEESQIIREWQDSRYAETGIRSSYFYTFYPTAIGTVGVCVCKASHIRAIESAIDENGKFDSKKYEEYMAKVNGEVVFADII